MDSEEAVREDAATQECAKLLLEEARRRVHPEGRAREESFQLLSDHLVEERLLRLVAPVIDHLVRGNAPGCGLSTAREVWPKRDRPYSACELRPRDDSWRDRHPRP
jgi:hypothetical protein